MALATIDRWARGRAAPAGSRAAAARGLAALPGDRPAPGRQPRARPGRRSASTVPRRSATAPGPGSPSARPGRRSAARSMPAARPRSASSTSRRADPRRLVGDHQVVVYGYELDAAAGTRRPIDLRPEPPRRRHHPAPANRRTGRKRTGRYDYIAGRGAGPRPGAAGAPRSLD